MNMQENNKTYWASPLKYAIILLIGVLLGIFLKGNLSLKGLQADNSVPVQEIINLVKSKYVDKITNDSADINFVNNYLSQLDPHSVYIAPSELAAVNEQLASNFKGIGVEFQQIRDSIFIAYVLKGGPADKAGLKVGDILLKANDTLQLSGKKWDGEAIRSKLKGPANSKLKLLVLSNKTNKVIVIERDNVSSSSIDAAYQIKPGVGYIRINKFADRTYEAFMQALEPLIKDSIKSLVLDLRGNGGGSLYDVIQMAGLFISTGPICQVKGKYDKPTILPDKDSKIQYDGPLIVMVDKSRPINVAFKFLFVLNKFCII